MNQQTIDIPSEQKAVAIRPSMAVGQALSVEDILAQVKLVQDVMRAAMQEGEHYGKIPGCGDKKTLLQPGAQKLTLTFRLAPSYDIQETDLVRGHKEYRVVCTLKSILNGAFVGQGVGCCSTMESKYRYRKADPIPTDRPVPKTYWENRDQKLLGGPGFSPKKIDGQWMICRDSGERTENENPADCYNTVLKMAKKRAYVDATITATAASDIFTQDIGDDEEEPVQNSPQSPAPARPQPGPMGFTSDEIKSAQRTKPALPACATENTRAWMIEQLKAGPGTAERMIVTEYAQKSGILLPDVEELEQWPLEYVPISTAQLKLLAQAIADFEAGEDAKKPFPANPLFGVRSVAKSDRKATAPAGDFSPETQVPRDANPDPNSPDAPWRSFPVPFGKHAGTSLADLDKATLFGFWANFEPQEKWQDKEGNLRDVTPMKAAKDRKFREMLDEAGKHYEFKPPADTED